MLKNFYSSIDISYTENIIDNLSKFGDDPVTGNRSAGSKACTLAAQYLYNKFNEIGLTSVTMDDYMINGWTFNGATLEYIDTTGIIKKITLGGYPTNFQFINEQFKLVYGGKGTLEELESLGDIKDKLVLISPLNTSSDYWISFPTYQAYVKEAAGVLIAATHNIEIEDNLHSNNICLPSYCRALSISLKDSNKLISLINSSENKEIIINLNSKSIVNPYELSYNIWGEIKGKTDDVIYLIAHYDGYYHSYFDDASGVSEILGIAKALIDSEYTNNKTIRVVAHGAKEWGKGYSPFDFSAGSYEQIFNIHPEWSKKAFSLINIDGNFPISKERNFVIYTSPELYNYVKSIVPPLLSNYPDYTFHIKYPAPLIYEDFNYQKAGIPSITAGDDFKNSIYYKSYSHSSLDNKSTGFDKQTHELIQILYGSLLIDLDNLPLRPMDFNIRFQELTNSLSTTRIDNSFKTILNELCTFSEKLSSKIKYLNSATKCITHKTPLINDALFTIYKTIQEDLLSLNYNNLIIFPHTLSKDNSKYLFNAIHALLGDGETIEEILNNYLLKIDLNYCVFDFDKNTYNFMSNRYCYGTTKTFGEYMYLNPPEDLYDVCHLLKDKSKLSSPDVTLEISMLREGYKHQSLYFKDALKKEYAACISILKLIKELVNHI